MARPISIHKGKTPQRIHYIVEHAEHRGYKNQAELVKATGVDKGTVSRWYNGRLPSELNLLQLAALFSCDEVGDLFRAPDDNWLSRKFKSHNDDERKRIMEMVKGAFPDPKTGTDG